MIDEKLLAHVDGPTRYIGIEHNMVRKSPDDVALRFAMCYPDVYEVGTSHLGSAIIYHILNSRPDTYCERAFVPAADAVELLRREAGTLRSLETATPLSSFHVVGITLQHELNYPGVLCLLDLGGIQLRSTERPAGAPLVIGGGPCTVNPEPMAPFFDAMFVGEAEDALLELADLLVATGVAPADEEARRAVLNEIAAIDGFYVPAHWQLERRGHFLVPRVPEGRDRVTRRIVADLDAADFPHAPIVAYREPVHDRAQLEISRGCTRGCRFCQAGTIYRPVRERSVETLRRQASEIIRATGYDEISLCSLSCTDYSEIERLLEVLHEDFSQQRVAVGLPSMRIDTFSVELARRVARVRKTGLTFAPEAGSQRMRDRINKNVIEQDLIDTVSAAVRSGWNTLKLYFMVGLPGELDEDVLAIADLAERVLDIARQNAGPRKGRIQLNVSVALFIPKPHTPFQWAAQDTIEVFDRKRSMLRDRIGGHRQIKLNCHDAEQAVVEAFLARGDRRCAGVIETAYRLGGFLDPWSEHFCFTRWEQAAAEHGIDLQATAATPPELDAHLPWDHIDVGVTASFLRREWDRAEQMEATEDCRIDGCAACGVERLDACVATMRPCSGSAAGVRAPRGEQADG